MASETKAMIATWIFGLCMLAGNPGLLEQGWMHVKILGVVLMSGERTVWPGTRMKRRTSFANSVFIPRVFMAWVRGAGG